VCHPAKESEESTCARLILTKLAPRAYRGFSTPDDVAVLEKFYGEGRKDGGSFDAGIEYALRRLLVSPEFLFRIESDPAKRRRFIVWRSGARIAIVLLPGGAAFPTMNS